MLPLTAASGSSPWQVLWRRRAPLNSVNILSTSQTFRRHGDIGRSVSVAAAQSSTAASDELTLSAASIDRHPSDLVAQLDTDTKQIADSSSFSQCV